MVITSMNMYEFSEKNNREMGVFITKNEDPDIYNKAVKETASIIQSSEIISLSKTKRKFFQKKGEANKNVPSRGYCIRCEERITHNLEKPYCWDCFSTWSQYENPEYEENVCHTCGQFEPSTMLKPQCYKCFKDSNGR